MGRRKKGNSKIQNKNPVKPVSRLKDETKYGILAIVLFALAAFFVLSSLDTAGLVGNYNYRIFNSLFGTGYYLVPIILLLLSASFLRSGRPNFIVTRLVGALLFFASSLGIVSIVWREESGGLIGSLLARPLVELFDIYFSLVSLGALLIISALVMFDTRLTLDKRLFGWQFGKQREDKGWEEKMTVEIAGENLASTATETAKHEGFDKNVPRIGTGPESARDDGFLSSIINLGKHSAGSEFVPPPLSLLEKDSGKPNVGDIKTNSNIIKRTLYNFGITVEMDEISIGPSITRYALKPAEGVKLSRIVALQNDLSLALAAHPLRIEAPIPGQSLVGIEIPNKSKSIVGLATLLGTKEFEDSPHPLTVALGKSISGLPHYANLARAPHFLIAGATGSGKSVMIHALIFSLLYKNSVERLRFIMVDPKRVELTMYNKIPHLLAPVITDTKKAIMALKWAAREMEHRYNILEAEACRDIFSYHKSVVDPYLAKIANKNSGPNDAEVLSGEPERMPYIAIIIDELADMMSTYPREMEAAVVRLAQMSRAVGIHLILSTQRPSVEVITGLIKANISSRIALQVASQIDSRTILDMAGAEKLLGAGDMLYISGEMSKPVRLQSAYISEGEVKKVVNYLAEHYADEPPAGIDLGEDKSGMIFSTGFGDNEDGDDDNLYREARVAVIAAKKASASYLQRKLKVGYARAARLLDMLEERGVIGPGEGAKPREVYETAEDSRFDDTSSEPDYDKSSSGKAENYF